MTLTDRLSALFLGALALILIGFATALHVMASVYLHRSVDERLSAAISTLSAMAEDEPGGFDWEHDERRGYPGQDQGIDQPRWIVFDDERREIDRSKNLANADRIESPGVRRLDRREIPWKVVEVTLKSNHRGTSEQDVPGRFGSLVIRAGLRLDPIEETSRTLAVALVLLSVTLWGLTALMGRRFCRRALAPLTKMAATARELGVDEPSRRLQVVATGDELEDLAFAFNGLLDRWHEALERQSRFAGDASHQLRTPLTALIGQVDVALRRDRPVEEYRRTLSRVRDQSERLRRIVEALLFLARADAESARPSLEIFDLGLWVDDQLLRRAEEASGDQIDRVESIGPVLTKAHPSLLAEVFDNLLDNARDHGKSRSKVEIRVSRSGACATLEVIDHGQGISPSDLSKIFEPFYRAGEARKASPGGVGLGLAIARRITEALGGTLNVESEFGQGSRFTIRLALAELDPHQGRPSEDP